MAAKKAIESSARITFIVGFPPGSAQKPSAMSATISRLRAALIEPPRLGDLAGRGERYDRAAQHHAVAHEHAQRVPRQPAQQERDRPVADDEREQGRDRQLEAAGPRL